MAFKLPYILVRVVFALKLLFSFFFFFFFVFLSTAIVAEKTNEEVEALLSFKASFSNQEAFSSWNRSISHCSWLGVSCSLGRVKSLSITAQSLVGPLSVSLFALSELVSLDLSSNSFISGEISPQIASLKRLETLVLSDNQLSGELPSQLGELTRLQTLRLARNSFSGKIPPEIGRLVRLKYLDLTQNSFNGTVPAELGNLSELLTLELSSNVLSGSLPLSLFENLRSLNSLDLFNNSISGPIPSQLGNLKNLTDLSIGSNRFSGQIPHEIGELELLEVLDASSCSIDGPLPEEFWSLRSLTTVDLSYNPLRCSIPKSIGKLTNLQSLTIMSAELNGSVPAEIAKCRNLSQLMLSSNSLSGPLPEVLSELPMVSFEVDDNKFSGNLPRWLGQWNQLTLLSLEYNNFSGTIPPEIGNCSMLEHVFLGHNSLVGPIPSELCNAVSLLEINFPFNFLSGTLERTLIKCTNLTDLVLDHNNLGGPIPDYFAELPLVLIVLDYNFLNGSIPPNIWKSKSLIEFVATNNQLEGSLTAEIANAAETIGGIDLSDNQLSGSVPKEIGELKALTFLILNSNRLVGRIPEELGNCEKLHTLDLGNNSLDGSIPESLTGLLQLQCLVLSYNNLTGPIPSKPSLYFRQAAIPDVGFLQHRGIYDLSHNRLSGEIPEELGNCFVIVNLFLHFNELSGEIPVSLSRLTNLVIVSFSGNSLTGSIPWELGDSPKLQGLCLAQNKLSGSIPESLGRLRGLVKLNLTGNSLSGSLPESMGNLKGLTHLDLSYNELSGEIPSSFSGLPNLVALYIQQNKLSGPVDGLFSSSIGWRVEIMNLSNNAFDGMLPGSVGNLLYLESLDLHSNNLMGEIPVELGNLTQLQYLDVSKNAFSGQIPETICRLVNLLYLSLAQNSLEGPIPTSGICQKLSKLTFNGNKNLCGSITGLNCHIKRFNRSAQFDSRGLIAAVIVATNVIILTIVIVLVRRVAKISRQNDSEGIEDGKLDSLFGQNLYFLSSRSKSKEPLSINVAMFEQPLLKLTLADILKATDNFCKTNIVGDGGFGTVYKATLPNEKIVAVKKLSEAKTQGQREFIAEMETLGKVKHNNLVPLLGYCSIGEEKLLVYEYMVNGSLDLWLRNRSDALEVLDWDKRFKIAVGAAQGLCFLHHRCIPHIIHRDIKASNILLDEDFEPKVADFGLARLISACETHVTTDIAGTLGYIPPEYGQSARSTTRGDVYSFGVILLELVTGKEPTGPNFKETDGGNLVGWVLRSIRKGQAASVLDPTVLSADSKPAMLQMLQIACLCLAESPVSRPTMRQVLELFKGIKDREGLGE